MLVLTAAFLISLVLSGCASAPPTRETETRVELDEDGRVVYIGNITDAANAKASNLLPLPSSGCVHAESRSRATRPFDFPGARCEFVGAYEVR